MNRRRRLRFALLEDRLAPAIATWGGGGADNHWTTAANWVGDIAPQPGDDLVFPVGPSQKTTVNDFVAGTEFHSITLSAFGYDTTGNAILLSGGIVGNAVGGGLVSRINLGITLTAAQSFVVNNSIYQLIGNLDLNGQTLTLLTDVFTSELLLDGSIVGSGAIVKDGLGFVIFGGSGFSGVNTYSGPTTIQAGTLRVDRQGLGASGPSDGTFVASGAKLELEGEFTSTGQEHSLSEPLVFAGSSDPDAISLLLREDWLLAGPVTLAGLARFQVPNARLLRIGAGIGETGGSQSLSVVGNFEFASSSNNTYTGSTTLTGVDFFDRFVLDGQGPFGPITVNSTGLVTGAGSVGPLEVASGEFASIDVSSRLTTAGFTLDADATDGVGIATNATPFGPDVHGTVHLAGQLKVSALDPLAPGTHVVVIQNDGSDPVQGTFQNLPEGTVALTYTASGTVTVLRITYVGGDGNDVELIAEPGPRFFAVGAGAGGGPLVKLYDGRTGALVGQFFAYDASFRGGVHVATADVNFDGIADIITAPGPGMEPLVKVFDGRDLHEIREFDAYDPSFTGGVFVAVADVFPDGVPDIVTGAGPSGGPHVKVFSGPYIYSGNEPVLLQNFFAYDANFRGGVSVAAGDANGDDQADIITGAGPGGGPHVRVFDGVTVANTVNFFAYDVNFRGGVNVAALPNVLGGLGIVTAPGQGGGPDIRVFLSHGFGDVDRFQAYDSSFRGGVNIGVAPIGPNGEFAILTGAGPTGGPHVKAFLPSHTGPPTTLLSFMAFDPAFTGGVYVG